MGPIFKRGGPASWKRLKVETQMSLLKRELRKEPTKLRRELWLVSGGVFIVVWWHRRALADQRSVK